MMGLSFVTVGLNKFKQAKDRGWSNNMRLKNGKPNTKKETQEDYEILYTGPDFPLDISYAEALKTLFVCITLSPLMPML